MKPADRLAQTLAAHRILNALADGTRRAIFAYVCLGGEVTVSGVAKRFGLSRQAVGMHFRALESAGLVSCRRGFARTNYYRVRSGGAAPLVDWLAQHFLYP